MIAARLERADLRVMDEYPGEHYPVEVDVAVGVYDEITGERGPVTRSELQLRCGCTNALEKDYGHR